MCSKKLMPMCGWLAGTYGPVFSGAASGQGHEMYGLVFQSSLWTRSKNLKAKGISIPYRLGCDSTRVPPRACLPKKQKICIAIEMCSALLHPSLFVIPNDLHKHVGHQMNNNGTNPKLTVHYIKTRRS